MADFDSSLPVRTEAAGDVDIFISDATISTQKLKVNADGSIDTNITIPAGEKIIITDGVDDLAVNADGSINVKQDKLDATTDNVAISDGTDTMAVNADGSINTVTTATDLDIRDLTHVSDSVAIGDGVETLAINTDGSINVKVDSDAVGDEICDFNTSVAVAKNASVNHDYTVNAAKTFIGQNAWVSGSGKLKAQLLVNGVIKWVGFNSTSNPNIDIPIDKMCKGAATEVIRITITNKDQAQDVYSTLTGVEV